MPLQWNCLPADHCVPAPNSNTPASTSNGETPLALQPSSSIPSPHAPEPHADFLHRSRHGFRAIAPVGPRQDCSPSDINNGCKESIACRSANPVTRLSTNGRNDLHEYFCNSHPIRLAHLSSQAPSGLGMSIASSSSADSPLPDRQIQQALAQRLTRGCRHAHTQSTTLELSNQTRWNGGADIIA